MNSLISSGRALLESRKGNAAMEFALLGPVFFLALLMLVDFGRMSLVAVTLEFAAQDGARLASMRGAGSADPADDTELSAYVRERVYGADASQISVSVSWSPDNSAGSSVTIAADHAFTFLMGLLPFGTIPLESTSTLVVQ